MDAAIAQIIHDFFSPTIEHLLEYFSVAGILWVVKEMKNLITSVQAMKDGQVSSWRMQIVSACKEGERQGWMDDEERRSLGELYDAYKAANADGIIDGYMERNKALPCVPRENNISLDGKKNDVDYLHG
jgi:hypothetical protein